LYNTPFTGWIEYYYDMEDCERLMEEEKAMEQDGSFSDENSNRNLKRRTSQNKCERGSIPRGQKSPGRKIPCQSVLDSLDELNKMIMSNGGQLPVETEPL